LDFNHWVGGGFWGYSHKIPLDSGTIVELITYIKNAPADAGAFVF